MAQCVLGVSNARKLGHEHIKLTSTQNKEGFSDMDPNKYLENVKFNSENPDSESLEDKIKAIKQVLNDPPDGLWNYDLLEFICIYWEENKVLTSKQKAIIDEAWEKWCA